MAQDNRKLKAEAIKISARRGMMEYDNTGGLRWTGLAEEAGEQEE